MQYSEYLLLTQGQNRAVYVVRKGGGVVTLNNNLKMLFLSLSSSVPSPFITCYQKKIEFNESKNNLKLDRRKLMAKLRKITNGINKTKGGNPTRTI